MQVTLKLMERLDDLLDETEEYIGCAMKHADDHGLKSAYLDLARCHFDGYERLSKEAMQQEDRKKHNMQGSDSEAYRQMCDWHREKFAKRASKIKMELEQVR